ncbi:DUF4394 domain-containing protein [Microlunatus capsulatus]|uniref:DUF4394 domain-containing protein n=1 Tax=Microlunatus capsulatus TaxID=99117 RepID=A0ABS4ZAM8_9ACTN|nr:DUF4394 domain-containing protein [Microlunatus capsulatus]MBP2418019.1 hypothetical protein [Microlunatus capsulatus]
MRVRRAVVAVAAVSAAAVGVPLTASATGSGGADAVGLTRGGTALVSFDTDRPTKARAIGTVRGLTGDTQLVGIDRRVQNGKLYGVGDQGGIYTLSARSAKATPAGRLTTPLAGTSFGVDFNPAANALRVVSDTGQNLRQPFGTGNAATAPTVVDGPLTYLGVPATGVAGAAYTNNDLAASTATSLFDLDTALDQVALQSPANAGSLAATGKLGVDAGSDVGFDIASTVRKGTTTGNAGFAVLTAGGRSGLYAVDLLTGDVDLQGRFPVTVTDLAVDLDR